MTDESGLESLDPANLRRIAVRRLDAALAAGRVDRDVKESQIADYATLAAALLAYADVRERQEAKVQESIRVTSGAPWGPPALSVVTPVADPESSRARDMRLQMQRASGGGRRSDIYGMQVCECTGEATAAPLVDGTCLRRWAQENGLMPHTDSLSVEQIIMHLIRRVDAVDSVTLVRVESDRFVVLLVCGHWMQTRVPRPNSGAFDCPGCGERREAARLSDGAAAVLGDWSPVDG